MSKVTAIAPSNIAFTKYWGRKDETLRLPVNGSISMCLSDLLTTTTVEFSKDFEKDEVIINKVQHDLEASRVIRHLDRIRDMAKSNLHAKVVSENSFPTGTGLSSSSSGFAALTLAGTKASGLELSEKDLTILARQGSGSACRSIPSGFVEWLDGDSSETSYAKTIFPENHWKIADVVAVVSEGKKDIATSEAHEGANTSQFMDVRVKNMKQKNDNLKKMIAKKSFTDFGNLIEQEALELHTIYLTQKPPLIYLMPNSLLIMKLCKSFREQGLEVYFTVNTGQDVHLIIEQKNIEKLTKKLKEIPEVREIIVNYPGQGTRISNNHLF